MAKLSINKMQDVMGFSAAMEAAFADFLVLARMAGHPLRRAGGEEARGRGSGLARSRREASLIFALVSQPGHYLRHPNSGRPVSTSATPDRSRIESTRL